MRQYDMCVRYEHMRVTQSCVSAISHVCVCVWFGQRNVCSVVFVT